MVASYEAEDVETLKEWSEEEWLAIEADMSKFKNISAEKMEEAGEEYFATVISL